MFSLKIVSDISFEYNPKTLDRIRRILSKSVLNRIQKGTVNIAFVSTETIQTLNKNYRKKDSVTDVLSFHYFDDFSHLKRFDIAGEIVLNEEKLREQAVEYGLGIEKEFYKLVIHSLLHIIGYDHESDEEYEAMRKVEEVIWEKIFGN